MAQSTRGGAPAAGASPRSNTGAAVEVARIAKQVLSGNWPESELGYRRIQAASTEEAAGRALAMNRRAHFARAEANGLVVLVKE